MKGTGGRLRRTISPVCGGPWRGRGAPRGAGCCCLLRLNSSYTLDTCHAVSIERKSTQQMTSALGCLEKRFLPFLPFYTPPSLYFRRSPTQPDDYLSHVPNMQRKQLCCVNVFTTSDRNSGAYTQTTSPHIQYF